MSDALDRLLAPQVAAQVRVELKLTSDRDAIGIFAQNLRELLLSAPFGVWSVLGIDPGQRTGCKCASMFDALAAVSAVARGSRRAALGARAAAAQLG